MRYFRIIISSRWLYWLIRFALGSIFVYAGFIKLIDPRAFARIISQYDLVPEILLAPVAIGIPSLELLAGLGLILNIRGSLGVIFGLLVTFVFVLWYGILRNLEIDCGCFTAQELRGLNGLKNAFYRDLIMITGVFYLFLYSRMRSGAASITFSVLEKLKPRRN
ncbi:MAG: MauE/DoxX family redox-associated membrane protein [Nitrospirota bacterium]